MSFGDRRLDQAYDRWATQTPEEYYGMDESEEDIDHEEEIRKELKKKIKTDNDKIIEKKDFADLMIHLSECLLEVDGVAIDRRVLKKYCDDFLDDNELKLEIK
jgi:hypothetical protein